MNDTAAGRIGWSRDFVVLDSAVTLGEALRLLAQTSAAWIVVRRSSAYLYAFRAEELFNWPPLRAARERGLPPGEPLEAHLGLQEVHRSTATPSRGAVPPIDRTWRAGVEAPSIERYVEVGAAGEPLAVGTIVLASRGTPPPMRSARPSVPLPAAPVEPPLASPGPRSAPPGAGEGAAPQAPPGAGEAAAPQGPPVALPADDEGTAPVRHPSIDADVPLTAGAAARITVDLLRKADVRTQGGPLSLGTLAADWKTLDLTVHLQCPVLEFLDTAQATITIARNAESTPATFKVRVQANAPAGPVAVVATFFDGARYCGSAVRVFEAAAAARVTPTAGAVIVERGAAPPDLTIHISKVDAARPGRLRWLVVTERFDGLPPALEEEIDLGQDPAAQAAALYKEFAALEPGQHVTRIEGFGSRLWSLAPAMFRAVYWALWDRHRRPLAIQFVSDEPHMPWELLRPVRPDESEIHPPLALKHAVARWIKRWDGYMRNRLPGGHICTIAPKYPTASRALPRAQAEAQMLVDTFAAQREPGTRAAVMKLLESAPAEPVAVLHFAGHGSFSPAVVTESSIKLEDGALAAAEIERPEVRLGRACRTLVFFNACEIGAAGAVFGEIGGWADAFLGRQFGGFIAPLWSVEDKDASIVAGELLAGIVGRHEPIGAALRAVREKHGAASPTFYSYLYYGDVTARIAS